MEGRCNFVWQRKVYVGAHEETYERRECFGDGHVQKGLVVLLMYIQERLCLDCTITKFTGHDLLVITRCSSHNYRIKSSLASVHVPSKYENQALLGILKDYSESTLREFENTSSSPLGDQKRAII